MKTINYNEAVIVNVLVTKRDLQDVKHGLVSAMLTFTERPSQEAPAMVNLAITCKGVADIAFLHYNIIK